MLRCIVGYVSVYFLMNLGSIYGAIVGSTDSVSFPAIIPLSSDTSSVMRSASASARSACWMIFSPVVVGITFLISSA